MNPSSGNDEREAGSLPPVEQQVLETLANQLIECQAMSAILRKTILKQKEELEVLSKTQQALHRTQHDLLAAVSQMLLKRKGTKIAPADIAEGTVASPIVNVHKSTALFCVGLPSGTGDNEQPPVVVVDQEQQQPQQLFEGDAAAAKRQTKVVGKRQRSSAAPPPPPQRAPSAQSNEVYSLVQNLLNSSNWRRAVELVSQLRHLDDRKPPLAAAAAAVKKPVEPVAPKPIEERMQTARRILLDEKLKVPSLLGRDDQLLMDVLADEGGGGGLLMRAEIIVPESNLFLSLEQHIGDDVLEDAKTIVSWAREHASVFPPPGAGRHFSGDFSEFAIAPVTDPLPTAAPTVRFISMTAGAGQVRDLAKLQELCKASKLWQRNSNNGLWKAEVADASFQRTVKQSGTYQKALTEVMSWTLGKCAELRLDQIWFKSKYDACQLTIQKEAPTRKRSRRTN